MPVVAASFACGGSHVATKLGYSSDISEPSLAASFFVDLLVPQDQVSALKEEAVNCPSLVLSRRQQSDFELLANGAFSPLSGFMEQTTYDSVVQNMILPETGTLFPMPVTLDVTAAKLISLGITPVASKCDYSIALRDEEFNLLGIMKVTEMYTPDRLKEAVSVFGTSDRKHPAVCHLLDHSGEFYLSGPVRALQLPAHYDYADVRHTPAEVRRLFQEKGWTRIAAFHTSALMHAAQVALTMRAAELGSEGGLPLKIFLHPVVGETQPGDLDYHTRTKCYKQALKAYPENMALLSLNPLSMRMGGPREALWHALVSRNYGCTHFIVNSDHATPRATSESGERFYDADAAQILAIAKQKEIGVRVLSLPEMVYLETKKEFVSIDEVPAGEPTADTSESQLWQLLRDGEDVPSWFTSPEIVRILRGVYPPSRQQGYTVFFTGLSGSGKSTIANALNIKLLEEGSRPVTLLDGDVVRQHLSSELGFSKEHRDLNVRRIGYVASEITKCRGVAICAPIAPYQLTRSVVRNMTENYGQGAFVEVHVATPIEVCEARDKKGLYAKARAGQLRNFTGIDDPYEAPVLPDVFIDTSNTSVPEALEIILNHLQGRGLIALEQC